MTLERRRLLFRVLGPALLVTGAMLVPGAGAWAQADHVDGYVSMDGGCVLLREHGGDVVSLRGDLRGMQNGDHVRLEGHLTADSRCGYPGFELSQVQAVWGDDNHRTTVYDHQNGEPFQRWAALSGRMPERRYGGDNGPGYERRGNAYGNEGRGNAYGNEGRGYRSGDERYRQERGYGEGRESAQQYPERYDRNGRYVYQGPYRRVTLVGRIHEAAGACPTLHTSHATFPLDGDLGNYQAGDRVSVNGYLYDRDPNAPCGGPTVVIRSIRGR
jgi:hypothetical protein